MQQISTMHYGRNSDHANEVMRFPGLEMFIYGERITKKQINSQINGWFRPKFRAKFKLLWRKSAKIETNSWKNEWFQLSYECWNLSYYGETLQKWRQIHAKMSDFALKSRAFFKLLWRGCVDRPKTPIAHGRKYFFICAYMENDIFT